MKVCSNDCCCLTCLLAPSGANGDAGMALQFRPSVKSSLHRPQPNIFAIVRLSSSFRHIQNTLEVIRMYSFVIRSWLGLVLRLGRNLQYVDSDGVPSLDAADALPYSCSVSFLASGLLFAREFSIFLHVAMAADTNALEPLRRADHVVYQWQCYPLSYLASSFLFARDLVQYPITLAAFSGAEPLPLPKARGSEPSCWICRHQDLPMISLYA